MSVELGRLPALLGREFFRSSVSTLRVPTFEDIVIFVYDVERCLGRLDRFDQRLIARITLEEYSREEAAILLGCDRATINRGYPKALDRLSRRLLDLGLMPPLPGHVEPHPRPASDACQEPKNVTFTLSERREGK
ncbi:MAG TPA: hypothetical protein VLE48_05790 [Terriglobales bacterium]|nr:hypothetical protein [Terriglobales bacterium]